MAIVLVMTTEDTRPLVPMVAQEQHQVIVAGSSGEVLGKVIHDRPDVIIIPEAAEPVEGVDLLAVLRRMTAACIIVVGAGGESRIAQSLLQGADLYVPLPVAPRQLQVRLRSLLRPRRAPRPTDSANAADKGDDRRSLFQGLSHREMQLLEELLAGKGSIVSPESLLSRVWGDRGCGASLRLYISRLRAKLARHGFAIQTYKGIGYRLIPSGEAPTLGG